MYGLAQFNDNSACVPFSATLLVSLNSVKIALPTLQKNPFATLRKRVPLCFCENNVKIRIIREAVIPGRWSPNSLRTALVDCQFIS